MKCLPHGDGEFIKDNLKKNLSLAIEATCAGVHFETPQTVDPTPGAVDGQFGETVVTSTLQAALSAQILP